MDWSILNIKVVSNDLDKLKGTITLVKKLAKVQSDEEFRKYIQDKCMQTLNLVMNQRLSGGTTNDEFIGLYKSSNHIVTNDKGFVIYNDAKIPVEGKVSENYPNGEFNIALAFEYGTGITGEGTYTEDKFKAWDYNVNNYNFGWYYKKNGEVLHTYGYMGFEIYRNTAIEIENNIQNWVDEYINGKEA